MAGRHANTPKPASPRNPSATPAMRIFLNTVPPRLAMIYMVESYVLEVSPVNEDNQRSANRCEVTLPPRGQAAARCALKTLGKREVTQVDGDHQQVPHRL